MNNESMLCQTCPRHPENMEPTDSPAGKKAGSTTQPHTDKRQTGRSTDVQIKHVHTVMNARQAHTHTHEPRHTQAQAHIHDPYPPTNHTSTHASTHLRVGTHT